MTIVHPLTPRPPAKLKVHAEQAIDAMSELLDFLHEQETPWHPGEISYLLMAATHHFMEKNGITPCPSAPDAAPPSKTATRSSVTIQRKKRGTSPARRKKRS